MNSALRTPAEVEEDDEIFETYEDERAANIK